MSIPKQLYQLQEVDLELESNEQALRQIAGQLGEDAIVVSARNKLVLEQRQLEELNKQQHSVEWEIDDLTSKLTTVEKELYSGKTLNPKELTNLQHEIDGQKARRNQLEDKALGIMDQIERITQTIATLNSQLKALETEWQSQQKQLQDHFGRWW